MILLHKTMNRHRFVVSWKRAQIRCKLNYLTRDQGNDQLLHKTMKQAQTCSLLEKSSDKCKLTTVTFVTL